MSATGRRTRRARCFFGSFTSRKATKPIPTRTSFWKSFLGASSSGLHLHELPLAPASLSSRCRPGESARFSFRSAGLSRARRRSGGRDRFAATEHCSRAFERLTATAQSIVGSGYRALATGVASADACRTGHRRNPRRCSAHARARAGARAPRTRRDRGVPGELRAMGALARHRASRAR